MHIALVLAFLDRRCSAPNTTGAPPGRKDTVGVQHRILEHAHRQTVHAYCRCAGPPGSRTHCPETWLALTLDRRLHLGAKIGSSRIVVCVQEHRAQRSHAGWRFQDKRLQFGAKMGSSRIMVCVQEGRAQRRHADGPRLDRSHVAPGHCVLHLEDAQPLGRPLEGGLRAGLAAVQRAVLRRGVHTRVQHLSEDTSCMVRGLDGCLYSDVGSTRVFSTCARSKLVVRGQEGCLKCFDRRQTPTGRALASFALASKTLDELSSNTMFTTSHAVA